jgi:transposase
MKYVGVDLHKDSLTVAVLDEAGTVLQRTTLPTKCRNRIVELFSSLAPCEVAVESVGFYHWFWALVRPHVTKMRLADPAGVRVAAGRKAKTDRNDAPLIAQLLQESRLPEAYVPDEPLFTLRQLVRLRHGLARALASDRRALRWVSIKSNLPGPAVFTSDRARKWELSQADKFAPAESVAAKCFVERIANCERELFSIERLLRETAARLPKISRTMELLKSIPGIGDIAALTVIAEAGEFSRFKDSGALACYAGLCPRVSQSGESVRHGHITKLGPSLLRWVLQQASWVAQRDHDGIRLLFNRIARKAGRKRAATAIARRLLTYCWSVVKRGAPFTWPDAGKAKAGKAPFEGGRKIEGNAIGGMAWSYQI